jgi:hypothetical protein
LDSRRPIFKKHCTHLQKALERIPDGPIFQDNPQALDDANGDGLRRQVSFEDVLADRPNLLSRLQDALSMAEKRARVILPNHTLHSPVVITSKTDCSEQFTHNDGIWKPHVPAEDMAYSALVALQDDTTLRLWPSGHKCFTSASKPWLRPPPVLAPIPVHTLRIPRDHMVLFRHDLPHAGSAYSSENIRLHFNLYAPASLQIDNKTGCISADWHSVFLQC